MFWSKRRKIFRFHDGKRGRAVDPLVVWRKLWTDPEVNLERELADAFDEDLPENEQLTSLANVAALTRRAFGIKPFEQGGLTEGECNEVLSIFLDYMAGVKKKHETPPMPSPPTDSASSDASQTTNSASV